MSTDVRSLVLNHTYERGIISFDPAAWRSFQELLPKSWIPFFPTIGWFKHISFPMFLYSLILTNYNDLTEDYYEVDLERIVETFTNSFKSASPVYLQGDPPKEQFIKFLSFIIDDLDDNITERDTVYENHDAARALPFLMILSDIINGLEASTSTESVQIKKANPASSSSNPTSLPLPF